VGGAFGLKAILRNVEASAAGAPPRPRFLMIHWPVGSVHYYFKPDSSGPTSSRILKPFADKGLTDDTIVLYGMDHSGLQGGPGAHECGTPFSSTGAHSPGNRDNGGETDDGCAGGPSFDQIFLNQIPELQTPGFGYVNAICDRRIDSKETSTRCLSYSYTKVPVQTYNNGQVQENQPLLPELSPALLWAQVFGGFSANPMDNTELLKGLMMRKSVLDHSRDELARLRTLIPNSEIAKIDAHAEVVRSIEEQLQAQIDAGGGVQGDCAIPIEPDGNLVGAPGNPNDVNPQGPGAAETNVDDSPQHEQIGIAHSEIIRAAFACDIIRVATFQWSPGTNHVSFGPGAAEVIGQETMYPGGGTRDPMGTYMHHPMSHAIGNRNDSVNSKPSGENGNVIEYLANVHTWYNTKTADIINAFKESTDINGYNLLDYTIIPYFTEIAEAAHSRDPLQALIFGGRALGMQGGQYQEVNGHLNRMWFSVAQAFLKSTDSPNAIFQDGTYTNGVDPIPGLYVPV
jgi:hypothetical protein